MTVRNYQAFFEGTPAFTYLSPDRTMEAFAGVLFPCTDKPKPPQPFDCRGLSRNRAAAYVGMGIKLFNAMVNAGRMPKPKEAGGKKIWDRKELDSAFDVLGASREPGSSWDVVLPK